MNKIYMYQYLPNLMHGDTKGAILSTNLKLLDIGHVECDIRRSNILNAIYLVQQQQHYVPVDVSTVISNGTLHSIWDISSGSILIAMSFNPFHIAGLLNSLFIPPEMCNY